MAPSLPSTKPGGSSRESLGYVGHGYGVGLNYLLVCEAGAHLSREASETAVALREIIAGRRRDFRMEYPCASSRGQRWFQARITRPEQDGTSGSWWRTRTSRR